MTTTPRPATNQKVSQPLTGPDDFILKQTLQVILKPFDYLESAYAKYGDLYATRIIGFPPFVSLNHPQAIEEVFTANPDLFNTTSTNAVLKPLLGAQSLLQIDGPAHQRRRKLLMPPFHGSRMRSYAQLIRDTTEQVMATWEPGQPFVMRSSTQEISLRVILQAVFGLNSGERYEELRHNLASLLDIFNVPWRVSFLFFSILQQDLGPWSPWGRFKRQRQLIDALLLAEIRDRQNQPPGEDILSLLLSARDEDGQPMTEEELRDELLTLLFAGHETTASALAWAFYWIHYLPEVGEKLQQELAGVNLDEDLEAIAKLPYLTAICNETLRIYPVAIFAFGRTPKVPFTIMGHPIEPGTTLAPCIYLLHHREDLYPNPKQFRPERFLERQFSPYEFIPFGGSNRRCVGYAFAQFEMKLVLATVLSQVKLALVNPAPIKPVRRGITFMPAGGVEMAKVG